MFVALISHPDCLLHEMGYYHPESPQRITAIRDRLTAAGMLDLMREYDAPLATREQLIRAHDPRYVDAIFAQAPKEGHLMLDPDTSMNPHSLNAALRAAGAVVLGVDLVMRGEAGAAFCNVRPPGHHADRAHAMGFCIFNNIAVGACHALAIHQVKRVAIVDFDVHFGNGTAAIFQDEPRLLMCSSFQHPYYPHVPVEAETGGAIRIMLPAGSGSRAFREGVLARWIPRLEAFAPELILISAGFDAHAEDDMAGLRFTDDDYGWVTEQVKKIADRFAAGRIVATLEGGYALSALGRSAAAHIKALMG